MTQLTVCKIRVLPDTGRKNTKWKKNMVTWATTNTGVDVHNKNHHEEQLKEDPETLHYVWRHLNQLQFLPHINNHKMIHFHSFPESPSFLPHSCSLNSVHLPHSTHVQVKERAGKGQRRLAHSAERSRSTAMSFADNVWRRSIWMGQHKRPQSIFRPSFSRATGHQNSLWRISFYFIKAEMTSFSALLFV